MTYLICVTSVFKFCLTNGAVLDLSVLRHKNSVVLGRKKRGLERFFGVCLVFVEDLESLD